MATPAVNKNVVSTASRLITVFNTIYGTKYSWYFSWAETRFKRNRPESIKNPIGPDGLRPLSGWDSNWANTWGAKRDLTWSTDNGKHVITAELGVPTSTVIGNDLLGDLGLGWANKQYGYSFPYGLEAAMRTRLLTKLREQKYSFGESLAELRETAGFVADVVEDLVRFSEATASKLSMSAKDYVAATLRVTGGDLQSFQKTGRVSKRTYRSLNRLLGRKLEIYMRLGISAWMAYQFALKPLLYDIDDARKALGETLFGDEADTKPRILTVRTSMTEYEVYKTTFNGQISPSWIGKIEVGVHSEIKGWASYKIELTSSKWAQQYGLTNSVSIAYELVPASWAIDYLLGMGEWLATLTPVEGASFVRGTFTKCQRSDPTGKVTFKPRVEHVNLLKGFEPQRMGFDVGRVQRELFPNYGVLPAFRPVFKNKLNLTRVANVMGLISSWIR